MHKSVYARNSLIPPIINDKNINKIANQSNAKNYFSIIYKGVFKEKKVILSEIENQIEKLKLESPNTTDNEKQALEIIACKLDDLINITKLKKISTETYKNSIESILMNSEIKKLSLKKIKSVGLMIIKILLENRISIKGEKDLKKYGMTHKMFKALNQGISTGSILFSNRTYEILEDIFAYCKIKYHEKLYLIVKDQTFITLTRFYLNKIKPVHGGFESLTTTQRIDLISTTLIEKSTRYGRGVEFTRFELIFLEAAENNDVDAILCFLKYDLVDINVKDIIQFTALAWAANKGYETLAEILLDNGAEIGLKVGYFCPLKIAVEKRNLKIIKLIVDKLGVESIGAEFYQSATENFINKLFPREQKNKNNVELLEKEENELNILKLLLECWQKTQNDKALPRKKIKEFLDHNNLKERSELKNVLLLEYNK